MDVVTLVSAQLLLHHDHRGLRASRLLQPSKLAQHLQQTGRDLERDWARPGEVRRGSRHDGRRRASSLRAPLDWMPKMSTCETAMHTTSIVEKKVNQCMSVRLYRDTGRNA